MVNISDIIKRADVEVETIVSITDGRFNPDTDIAIECQLGGILSRIITGADELWRAHMKLKAICPDIEILPSFFVTSGMLSKVVSWVRFECPESKTMFCITYL